MKSHPERKHDRIFPIPRNVGRSRINAVYLDQPVDSCHQSRVVQFLFSESATVRFRQLVVER
jgi:hypothetical protein